MKKLFIALLLIPLYSYGDFTLTISNEAIITNNSFANLGEVSIQGCSSSTLSPMSAIKEGSQDAVCIEQRNPGDLSITLIIPFKIEYTTTVGPMKLEIDIPSNVNQFTDIKFFKTRNQQIGGGTDMIIADTVLNNNDVINAELELKAQIIGNNAKSQYESYIVFIIGPDL